MKQTEKREPERVQGKGEQDESQEKKNESAKITPPMIQLKVNNKAEKKSRERIMNKISFGM